MTASEVPRLFRDEGEIRRIGLGLLDRTLPKEQWTHEAHLAACLWIVTERPEILPERNMREIISGYNAATGGLNDDRSGYHDTITHCFIDGVGTWLSRTGATSLLDPVNGLLLEPEGQRDWSLGFYSRASLFSVEARWGRIAPDVKYLP